MRRTVTRERSISFKQALNDAVRTGLREAPGRRRCFVQRMCSMGWDPHFRWDKALALSDAIEDEESIRKLSMRK